MNEVECYVKEVLSDPYEMYGLWCVDVIYDSYGSIQKGTIYGLSKNESLKVKIGYMFMG